MASPSAPLPLQELLSELAALELVLCSILSGALSDGKVDTAKLHQAKSDVQHLQILVKIKGVANG